MLFTLRTQLSLWRTFACVAWEVGGIENAITRIEGDMVRSSHAIDLIDDLGVRIGSIKQGDFYEEHEQTRLALLNEALESDCFEKDDFMDTFQAILNLTQNLIPLCKPDSGSHRILKDAESDLSRAVQAMRPICEPVRLHMTRIARYSDSRNTSRFGL